MQSRISGHSNGGGEKRGEGRETETRPYVRASSLCRLWKDAWQREGDGEKTRQDNCQGSATIFITRVGEGGRERKNHNGQLGYKLHQPLCGSLNDVSSKEGRGTGPCWWKRRALTFLFIALPLVPPRSLPFR